MTASNRPFSNRTPHKGRPADTAERGSSRFALHRLVPIGVLIAGLVIAYCLGATDFLSFKTLHVHRDELEGLVAQNPVLSVAVFMLIYIVVVALSLPAGSILTIVGGFLFGVTAGTLYVVTAATLGALIVYLAARYAFYDYMRAKAGNALRKMQDGFAEDALSYLMVLRLVPLFPFWLVNLVPALLGVKIRAFLLGTLIGIIPGTFVYVSIGDGLGALFDQGKTPDFGIIFDPRILTPIIGLAILALIPVAYKKYRKHKAGSPTS
ncbi:membrane protein [Thalassospira profundimaris]|uniref:TVP38/TMEM64 family membrane protein n=1 Tax=Thalassospira profundimaris TaxID=502049 RepID=A0A367WKG7_9PROT|nr:TVP38/TMEM64 family protein [Thalassospira profundimaris]RCK41918.1 membrane protein [Thalassospira profundimaris]